MKKASDKDRAYFARVARQAGSLKWASAPESLAEMFARLEQIREAHGPLSEPGIDRESEGDLKSHLAFLARVRMVREREAGREAGTDAVRDEPDRNEVVRDERQP